ncbi:uncharacterized protein LOC132053822 [Lycium ferocissimum]|uniref:uncharacterized protein LOC132053822 n=1 Tax=Lycium ferocissimum TaxID=112874 RepID=UPI00281524B9|nr:uncharacterized protein LOC132053822 [Lycium ferocissimum]
MDIPEDHSDTNVNHSSLLNLSNDKHSEKAKSEYRILLNALIDVAGFVLKQGLPFIADEERKCLGIEGNFEAFLQWYGDHVVPDVGRVMLENAQMHQTMIAPSVQKDIVNACAKETIKTIVKDLNGDYFGILVGKSEGACDEEQMTIVLRYVAKKGIVIERFIGIINVTDKSAQSLKETIDSLLMSYSLSPSKTRGQGYNGDTNMEREINNDLKTLILQDNRSSHCTHCFAQPLHLTLVAAAVAKRECGVDRFFGILTFVLKVIGVSFESQDFSQEKQFEKLEELLKFGKVLTKALAARHFNQKYELERSGDVALESHFKTLLSFVTIFSSVVHVLEVIASDGFTSERIWADDLLDDLQSFEFVFILHMMLKVLSVTEELNVVLQRKDQTSKRQFEMMRDGEWEHLMDDVSSFCIKHDILITKMHDLYVLPGKGKPKVSTVTYSHHYRVEVFDAVIDSQLKELDKCFDKVNHD